MSSLGQALSRLAHIPTTDQMAWGMIISAGAAGALLLAGVTAPYGRYSSSGWGPLIPARIAWITQEIWSLAVPLLWLALGPGLAQSQQLQQPSNVILLTMFLVHYINRDLIYPFRIVPGKPTPLVVWTMAASFCIYNGIMQSRYLLEESAGQPLGPRFLLGVSLWAAGFAINLHSDGILIRQRRGVTRKGHYVIPRGGLFELVSAANYTGEVLEWTGWALAAWALPATAFAVFTAANLLPRALHHHAWYKKRFPAYPRERKAVIPFVL